VTLQWRPDEADPGRFAGWREAGVDPTKPSIARVYDYWLGGTHNLAADRELGRMMETLDPRIPAACRANRAFLGRAVRFLAGSAGVRQFIDIGSGIPTAGNVHEVAERAAPDARVVYADRDPVAVAEGRRLLAGNPRAAVIQADLRDPAAILSHPETGRLIDLAEPVGLILVAILHFILDAQKPHGIVERLRDAVAPGSYLVVSHATSQDNPRLAAAAERVYNAHAADGQARSPHGDPEVLRRLGAGRAGTCIRPAMAAGLAGRCAQASGAVLVPRGHGPQTGAQVHMTGAFASWTLRRGLETARSPPRSQRLAQSPQPQGDTPGQRARSRAGRS
jgi:S-adenosyl methyltransferase